MSQLPPDDYRRHCAACGSTDRVRFISEDDSKFWGHPAGTVERIIGICYDCDEHMECALAWPRRWWTRLLARAGLRLVQTFPRKRLS